MAKTFFTTIALAALVSARPQDSSSCQYLQADIPAPTTDVSCSDSKTFALRIRDCNSPYNGHFVSTSPDSPSSLILDTTGSTPWGATQFTTSEDPNSHLVATGAGTPDGSAFSNRAMTSTFNTGIDSDALENQYGYMALRAEGEDEADANKLWLQAYTSVGDYSGQGYDGVYFEWAGNARCRGNFVRFTSVQEDGSVKLGAACSTILGQVPGQVQEAEFEAVYTCRE